MILVFLIMNLTKEATAQVNIKSLKFYYNLNQKLKNQACYLVLRG